MCNFWNFGHLPCFMPKYGKVRKLARILETAVRRAKKSSISTTWVRKRLYVHLLELWLLAKLHAQIWQCWRLARILETAARRATISSILTPQGRKRVYVQLPGCLAYENIQVYIARSDCELFKFRLGVHAGYCVLMVFNYYISIHSVTWIGYWRCILLFLYGS